MNSQGQNYFKNPLINAFIVLFLAVPSTYAGDNKPSTPLTVALYNKPLIIYPFPTIKGRIHSNFEFNLEPFFTVVTNEINYRVTNNLRHALYDIEFRGELPAGLTLAEPHSWERGCGRRFYLHPGDSCLLRFYVDETIYTPTNGGDPLICTEDNECFSPVAEQQFNNAVELSPGPTHLQVTPENQGGLFVDSTRFIIKGTPNQAGTLVFNLNAYNKNDTAEPSTLIIAVSDDS